MTARKGCSWGWMCTNTIPDPALKHCIGSSWQESNAHSSISFIWKSLPEVRGISATMSRSLQRLWCARRYHWLKSEAWRAWPNDSRSNGDGERVVKLPALFSELDGHNARLASTPRRTTVPITVRRTLLSRLPPMISHFGCIWGIILDKNVTNYLRNFLTFWDTRSGNKFVLFISLLNSAHHWCNVYTK